MDWACWGFIRGEAPYIISKGAEVTWPNEGFRQPTSPKPASLNEEDLTIITALSMNARISRYQLGRMLGLGSAAVYSRIKNLERKFGLDYTVETDLPKLYYSPFLIFIKFTEGIPPIDRLKEVLSSEPKIQFAMKTSGTYDLIAYMLDGDAQLAQETIWKLRQKDPLNSYPSTFIMTPFSINFGWIPFRDIFFQRVLKERVWKRTLETPEQKQHELSNREFVVIEELNKNSNIDATLVDNHYGFPRGTTNYIYKKLLEKEIVIRPTISLNRVDFKYIQVIFLEYVEMKKFASSQPDFLLEIIKEGPIIDKYLLVGDIGSPNGIILFLPVTNPDEADSTVDYIKSKINGIKVNTLLATNTLLGKICYRRTDKTYLSQYTRLLMQKRVEEKQRRDYGLHQI